MVAPVPLLPPRRLRGRAGNEQEITQRPSAPATPSDDIRRGFVNDRVQHVTLKSIANNPDIREA